MSKYTSTWDDGFHVMPADRGSDTHVSYSDLFGLVLVKRVIDPTQSKGCMSFATMAARIYQSKYDLSAGVLPDHGGWVVVYSSTRPKTADEATQYGSLVYND